MHSWLKSHARRGSLAMHSNSHHASVQHFVYLLPLTTILHDGAPEISCDVFGGIPFIQGTPGPSRSWWGGYWTCTHWRTCQTVNLFHKLPLHFWGHLLVLLKFICTRVFLYEIILSFYVTYHLAVTPQWWGGSSPKVQSPLYRKSICACINLFTTAPIRNAEHFRRLCVIAGPEVMHWAHKNGYNSGSDSDYFWYASSATAANASAKFVAHSEGEIRADN